MERIVRVSCLKHVYPDTTEIHICGLDFVVERGERIVVLGGNGSGKTTLLYHILGLLEPNEGSITVFGKNPVEQYADIRRRIGVLLQNVDDQLLSPTVWEDIAFSPRNYGYKKDEISQMVDRVMAELGIQHLRNKICHYLSGGEKRKVALAGALVMHPDLLILDEPFEGLDSRSRAELVMLLTSYHQQGMTIILSTHDLNFVSGFADRVYVLAKGHGIVTAGTPADIFQRPEALQASHIDPPLLTELFLKLREQGIVLDIPAHVDQAVQDLVRFIRK
ncbi:MAG: ABC transporter ATP-binding protein [Nitrospirota bacterium]